MRDQLRRFLAILLFSPLGCSAPATGIRATAVSTTNPSDVLHPQMIQVPMLAWNSTFGGIVEPNALNQREMRVFLERRLPRPADIPPTRSLKDVIERASGKILIWQRTVDTDSFTPIDQADGRAYSKYFFDSNRQRTLRDALGALLGYCNSKLVNMPAKLDYMFWNYAVITDRYIIIIALPIGPYYHQGHKAGHKP